MNFGPFEVIVLLVPIAIIGIIFRLIQALIKYLKK